MSGETDALVAKLRGHGLTFPGAHRKAPWPEHDDLAVNDKTFAYLPAAGAAGFTLSVKLPYTGDVVLDRVASPTPTGSAGRLVSLSPADDEIPALDQLKNGLSKAIAPGPKRLVKERDARLRTAARRAE